LTIHLRAELEELIRQDIQRGPYQTVEQFLEHAVRLLHEQEVWFASHRTEIAEKVEEGWNAAIQGKLVDEAQAQSNMREKKRAWLEQHRQA
jgi:Arc/MetJ-type ribon-helix-helix transcriptional regulator